MSQKIIIGAGGFARETADVAEAAGIDLAGFVVDAQYGSPGTLVNGYPILGDLKWLKEQTGTSAIVGIGLPHQRWRIVQRLEKSLSFYDRLRKPLSFYNIIHPSALLSRWLKMGHGIVMCAGNILTTQVYVGDHVHINMDCTVGHDTVIGDFVTMSPGVHISGNVSIGKGAFLGTGAVVIEDTKIGAWSIVGAGATITQDVAPNTTVVGINRVVKVRKEGWHVE
jgi:sugar O-acyltransferase (sialic acid O-acetyltransferase NeuD family)